MQYSFSLNSFGVSTSESSPGVGFCVVVLSLSHQRKKKKRSLETALWMSIWCCSSPATYCQPAAASGFIYCRSQEWASHSPSPSIFVYLEFSWMYAPFVFSSIQPYPPVAIAVFFYFQFAWGIAPPPLSGGMCHTSAVIGAFPSPSTLREMRPHPTSPRLVYLQFAWGSAPPSSSGDFHMTATVTSFPCSKIAGQGSSLLRSLAGLFINSSHEGVPFPHSPELTAPRPLCYMSSFYFFSAACLLFSFFFLFSLDGFSLSRGLCWFVPGSTTCHLFAHLVFSQAG
jgi:hypothetical protein